tara:strand:+ start:472 stop:1635 length:1164 start_codon:yes stop_codon:yes gene_type:complete
MKKHKIFYLAPEITLPGTHGGSSHVEGVVRSLSKLGHKVLLFSKWEKGLAFTETKGNLTILRKPFPKQPLLKNLTYLMYSIFLTPLLLLFYSIDIVYERSRLFSGIVTLYAKFLGKKVIYELNEPIETIGEGKKLQNIFIAFGKFVAERANLVTGTHPIFFKNISKWNNLLIDYGANPKEFHPKVATENILKKYKLTKNKVILYSGSFAPWHNIPAIIESAKEVIKKDKQIKYLLIGEGQHYFLAQQLIKKYKLEKNVILTGNIHYKNMPAYVNTATITLAIFDKTNSMIQKYGYFYSPIKLHEYKAAEKPIIASNMGNLKKYVLSGKNGYLVNQTTLITDLSKTTLKLLKNKKLRQTIGKRNRQEVLKTYNWDTINEKILTKLERK